MRIVKFVEMRVKGGEFPNAGGFDLRNLVASGKPIVPLVPDENIVFQ